MQVEGIDRCGDMLALTDITAGHLHVLNASCVACGAVGSLKLSTGRALHVRLTFVPDASAPLPWGGCGGGSRGRVFALVTSPEVSTDLFNHLQRPHLTS